MATTKGLKFFHVDRLPSSGAIDGGIYFDRTHGELAVRNGDAWEKYSGNVKDVKYVPLTGTNGSATSEEGKLTITYIDGSSVTLDFSQVASKDQVAAAKTAAVTEAKNYVNARKVNGKTLDTDITLTGADIALDGYTKPASTSDIEATDTINQALGKLEAAIEDTGGNALTQVAAGAGIDVTKKSNHNQTISVKIDAASEKFGVGESAVPVLTASGDGLKISGIKKAIDTAIGGLDVEDAAVANKYVSSVSETDGKITVSRANLPVIGVADGDKILSLSGAKIGADLSLTYDKGAKKIYLYGKAKGGSETGKYELGSVDCKDFIKDGMLDNATYDHATHKLTLTFNTASGKEDIDVDLSKLVDTYLAADGIKLDETGTHPTFKLDLDRSDYLSITGGKLRLDDNAIHTRISGDITSAINGLNSDASNAATGAGDAASSQIKVQVSEEKGVLTGVTVTAPDFAEPSDITAAETKLIGSSTTDTEDSNTIWGAKKYADTQKAAAESYAKTYTDGEIQKLNADLTQEAVPSAESSKPVTGLALHVKQENGKVTEFSGSMNWCEW